MVDILSGIGNPFVGIGSITMTLASILIGVLLTLFIILAMGGYLPFLKKYPYKLHVVEKRATGIFQRDTKMRFKKTPDGKRISAMPNKLLKHEIEMPAIDYKHLQGKNEVWVYSPAPGEYRVCDIELIPHYELLPREAEILAKLEEKGLKKEIREKLRLELEELEHEEHYILNIEPIATPGEKAMLAEAIAVNDGMFSKLDWLTKIGPIISIIIACVMIGLLWYFGLNPYVDASTQFAEAAASQEAAMKYLFDAVNTVITNSPVPPPPPVA